MEEGSDFLTALDFVGTLKKRPLRRRSRGENPFFSAHPQNPVWSANFKRREQVQENLNLLPPFAMTPMRKASGQVS
jgi:hypothetical protein